MDQQFEWDKLKADTNVKKHGVSFDEALTVFADPLARIRDDPDHSGVERREIIIGHAVKRRVLVGFTERETKVRIINAPRAAANERKNYEEDGEKPKGH